jgi:hypothetical protein
MANNFRKLSIISFGREEGASIYHGRAMDRIIRKLPI